MRLLYLVITVFFLVVINSFADDTREIRYKKIYDYIIYWQNSWEIMEMRDLDTLVMNIFDSTATISREIHFNEIMEYKYNIKERDQNSELWDSIYKIIIYEPYRKVPIPESVIVNKTRNCKLVLYYYDVTENVIIADLIYVYDGFNNIDHKEIEFVSQNTNIQSFFFVFDDDNEIFFEKSVFFDTLY